MLSRYSTSLSIRHSFFVGWIRPQGRNPPINLESVKYPDVINARQEIASLKIDPDDAGGRLDLAKHIIRLDGEFATLRKKYSEIHPGIVNLRNPILASDEELKSGITTMPPPITANLGQKP
jgi:hypothetical protein